MLNFYNKHIFLDFEVFHTLTENMIMFCDNPYTSLKREQEQYIDKITVSDFIKRPEQFVFMTFSQLKGFVNEWYNKSNLLTNINMSNWVNDYYKSIKIMSDIEGESLDYTSFNSVFRPRQKWIIDNLDLNETNTSPIIFDINVRPELSMMIDDVLYCRKLNICSMYEEDFEKNIKINNYKCIEYQNKSNRFGIEYIKFKPYNECKSIEDLCYLYFPLSGESVNSNYIHIKNCLERYLES